MGVRDARPLPFILLSAVLLLAAYPLTNWAWLAWVALVPLFHALIRIERLRHAWWLGYLHGLVFYLGLLYWLTHVTVVGYLLLAAYLACFPAAFAAGVAWCYRVSRRGALTAWLGHPLARLLVIPSWWVCLEWLRAHWLTGFGWGLLAYTQASHPVLIQAADLIGAYGVSWILVAVNVAIGQMFRAQSPLRKQLAALTCGVIMALLIGYGVWRVQQPLAGPPLHIAVVQGNIPQAEKWDAAYQQTILGRYETLTREAAQQQPDLIIWPETAVPGYFPIEGWLTARLQALAREVRTPLLVGTPATKANLLDPAIWNSAVLLDADGQRLARYDKLHLVPFGEFIPFERQFPWLREAIVTGDFDRGEEATVFALGETRFSVLICFEDIFPELSRQFVQRGARLLVNITNDAWFGRTSAPYQHLQASILRAVEFRVPVVRSANTGISGFIDARGRVRRLVADAAGNPLFITGTAVDTVTLAPPRRGTLYQRWGDWWVALCAGLVACAWLAGLLLPRLARTR